MIHKVQKSIVLIAFLLFSSQFITAQHVDSDQWSAIDALERKVIEYQDSDIDNEKEEHLCRYVLLDLASRKG